MLLAFLAEYRFTHNTLFNSQWIDGTFFAEDIHAGLADLFFFYFFLKAAAPVAFLFGRVRLWEFEYILHNLLYYLILLHSFLVVVFLGLELIRDLLSVYRFLQWILVGETQRTEVGIEHQIIIFSNSIARSNNVLKKEK